MSTHMNLDELKTSRTVVINAPAETLYDLVADLPRMQEWSPASKGATWDEGAGPTAGSWFTGHNLMGGNTYDTRCEITEAERPTVIAWMSNGKEKGVTEWRYTFTPTDGGTEVTESWTPVRQFPPERADEARVRGMAANFGNLIEQTLANLKAAAES